MKQFKLIVISVVTIIGLSFLPGLFTVKSLAAPTPQILASNETGNPPSIELTNPYKSEITLPELIKANYGKIVEVQGLIYVLYVVAFLEILCLVRVLILLKK